MRAKHSQEVAGQRPSAKTDGSFLWAFNQLLIFFCLVGLGLSLYAYTVELVIKENKSYKPFCDINNHMSCTKVYSSPYGKGFGIFGQGSVLYKPNSFYGIVFYSMVATLSLFNSPMAVNGSLVLIILSNFSSLYFAYISYFVLKALCVVCLGIYVVNVINLILITKKHQKVRLINEMIHGHEQSELKKKED